MDLLELSQLAQFRILIALFLFLAMLLIMYVAVSIEFVINYIICKLGIKGFACRIGWSAGAALMFSGAGQLFTAVMLSLFSLGDT